MNAFESKKRFGLSWWQSRGRSFGSHYYLNDDRLSVVKFVGASLVRARTASRLEIGAMAQPASRFQTCVIDPFRDMKAGDFLARYGPLARGLIEDCTQYDSVFT